MVEYVFAYPGIGQALVDASLVLDINFLELYSLVIALISSLQTWQWTFSTRSWIRGSDSDASRRHLCHIARAEERTLLAERLS